MKEFAFLKPYLREMDTDVVATNKQFMSAMKLFIIELSKLNVPFYDVCCSVNNTIGEVPVRWDVGSESFQFYNPQTNTWDTITIPTGDPSDELFSLSVGPMMELVEDGAYTSQSPFLRVRDSGLVTILDWTSGGFSYLVKGRRYGRCITLWMSITPSSPNTADWSIIRFFPNGWILGRPDDNMSEIRHFQSGSGSAPNYVDAGLAIWYLNEGDVAPAIQGYSSVVHPASASMVFSYTTSDAWPVGIPTDATGAVIDNPVEPTPTVMTITLDDSDVHELIGDFNTWVATVDQTPDEPLVLHLQVLGGDSRDYTMTNDGGGSWHFGPWQSYYTAPTWDVDETLQYYVSGKYNGVTYTSITGSADGV